MPQMTNVALEFGKREVGFVTLLSLPPSIFPCQRPFCPVIVAVCFTFCVESYFCLGWLDTVVLLHSRRKAPLTSGQSTIIMVNRGQCYRSDVAINK